MVDIGVALRDLTWPQMVLGIPSLIMHCREKSLPPRSVFGIACLENRIVLYGGKVDPSTKGHDGAGDFSLSHILRKCKPSHVENSELLARLSMKIALCLITYLSFVILPVCLKF
jgi:hypothetical protein